MKDMGKVALIGLGAMGAFFAPKLKDGLGDENFWVVASGDRKTRLEKGIVINGEHYNFRIKDGRECSSDPADLVIIAVKEVNLDEALEDIRPFVGPETQIMSTLNGITSDDRTIACYGESQVVYSYMRVSSAMVDGVASYDPDFGEVHFGEKDNHKISERVQKIKELFERVNIRYGIDDNMIRGIWYKFMSNIGENMTCALLGIPFGALRASEHAKAIRVRAMKEVVAIAKKKGIDLSEDDVWVQEEAIGKIRYTNKPSTLQDLERKRKTEIDTFAKTVMDLGEKLNVDTPVNWMYYHAIKVYEEKNQGLLVPQEEKENLEIR